MILASIYFLLFCFAVARFSFFKDTQLSFRFILTILFLKVLGCLAYYWVYFYYYPGNFQSDSSSTMHDAAVIYNALPGHPADYFKMIFGFHSEAECDPLYQTYFKYIDKWGRADVTTEFFLNDNRTPIRLNALIMLISFGSYAVHALCMLVLSFTGQFAFYKAFKEYFPGKEKLLALVIFITPSVLFWTSGVLKEPFAICLTGLFVYTFFKIFLEKNGQWKYIITLFLSVVLFLILKPYVLILLLLPMVLFVLCKRFHVKRVMLFYLACIVSVYSISILGLKYVFHKDVINTIVTRQNDFVSLSKGGIFFLNDRYYLRMEYTDINGSEVVDEEKKLYRIKPHEKLMYWDIYNLKDTVFVTDNKDTSIYRLLTVNAPAGSGIHMNRLHYSFASFAKALPQSFFNVACRPFFIDSRSMMEHLASAENLMVVVFFGVCFMFRKKEGTDKNVLWMCMSTVVLSFILVGITTTVMGAIVRYKVPFIPFLLMIPLLYLDAGKLVRIPVLKWLVNNKS